MFSDNEIMSIAKYLNIDFTKFPFEDFKRGIKQQFIYFNSIINYVSGCKVCYGQNRGYRTVHATDIIQ